MADSEPGDELQVDFGRMGLLFDPDTGRRRVVHVPIFTACFSRHCRRAEEWCCSTAGLRIHGTTACRPVEHFALEELPRLLPAPVERYDLPIYARAKVHRDHHIEVAKALYSIPGGLIGQRVDTAPRRRRRPPGRRSLRPAPGTGSRSASSATPATRRPRTRCSTRSSTR